MALFPTTGVAPDNVFRSVPGCRNGMLPAPRRECVPGSTPAGKRHGPKMAVALLPDRSSPLTYIYLKIL